MCFAITGQHVNWDRWLVDYSNDRPDVTLDVLCDSELVMDWRVVEGDISDKEAGNITGLFCQS